MALTILCIATYRKGDEFLRECRRQGCRVLLLTDEKLRDSDWPREAIDAFYYVRRGMSDHDIRDGAAYLARTERLDRIVALDDFDVETGGDAARIPAGARHGADDGPRLPRQARDAGESGGGRCSLPGILVALNDGEISEWTARVPAPWVVKPRSQAAAIGIRRVDSTGQLWQTLAELGDARADYLIEAFVPGDVYHVDSIVFDGRIVFARTSRYRTPPMAVAHEGGIFVTATLPESDGETGAVRELNERILTRFGLHRGVSHTEFIRSVDGEWYFLETSARVGGAYIVDVVEAASGLNLWREWARAEIAGEQGGYEPAETRDGHAGIVLSLARQAAPDTSDYRDPEIVQRIVKSHHAGLIVASPEPQRVLTLLDSYVSRFQVDFHASAPAPARPID